MKQLACEVCGGTDLIKEEGVIVCQHCGMKYSLEEAKKMMIEGTVNIVGTVKIDNSGSYDNIIELARDAFKDKRYESSYDYYCQAVEIKQNDIENTLRQGLSILGKEGVDAGVHASCKSRVFKAIDMIYALDDGEEKEQIILSAINDIQSVVVEVKEELNRKISNLEVQKMKARSAMDVLADLSRPAFVASQNQAEDKKIERHNSMIDSQISPFRIRKMTIDDFLSECISKLIAIASINSQFRYYYENDFEKAVELYSSITLSAEEQKELVEKKDRMFEAILARNVKKVEMLIQMGVDLDKKIGYPKETPLFKIAAYKCTDANRENSIKILRLLIDNGATIDINEVVGERSLLNTDTDEEIVKIISEKVPNAREKITQAPQTNSGCCYVATAVYGSYDCPQVWTLRRFRDDSLAKTWYGRTFVHVYYAISPTLVKWFGKTMWFQKIWRSVLDHMVDRLQRKGYESTPYNDREW